MTYCQRIKKKLRSLKVIRYFSNFDSSPSEAPSFILHSSILFGKFSIFSVNFNFRNRKSMIFFIKLISSPHTDEKELREGGIENHFWMEKEEIYLVNGFPD